MTRGERELRQAGFGVSANYGGRWFETVAPNGERGVFLRQSAYRWHWFLSEHVATGSGSNPTAAMSGGLGDVIDTDSQLRTYSRLVLEAPAALVRVCASLYTAQTQV
jgi:hypothetical protein